MKAISTISNDITENKTKLCLGFILYRKKKGRRREEDEGEEEMRKRKRGANGGT